MLENEVKFFSKLRVQEENNGKRKNLKMFITKREDKKSLLGTNWFWEIYWTAENFGHATRNTDQSEKEHYDTQIWKTVQNRPNIQRCQKEKTIDAGHPRIKQASTKKNTRRKPYHLQKSVISKKWLKQWNTQFNQFRTIIKKHGGRLYL